MTIGGNNASSIDVVKLTREKKVRRKRREKTVRSYSYVMKGRNLIKK